MRKISVQSFDELRVLKEGLTKADMALANAVARGALPGIQNALKAGASPLQAQDTNGRSLLLQAYMHPNGEDLVCELLSNLPPLRQVRQISARQSVLHFDPSHQLTVQANGDEEEKALASLAQLLQRSLVWNAAYATRKDEQTSFVRLRDLNNKLVEAAKQGQADLVEAALSEGASVLATDAEGKPALTWAAEHAKHAQLVGAMLANDPSVSILRNQFFRNLPNARMIKGGTAPFLESDDLPLEEGHEIHVRSIHIPTALRAHLQTRDELADEMADTHRFFASRGVPTEIRWPNVVDFQRLLQERFEASLWAVESEQNVPGSPTEAEATAAV